MRNSKSVLYLLFISPLCESFLSSLVHLKPTSCTAASALGNPSTETSNCASRCNNDPAFSEKCIGFLAAGVIFFSIASSPVYAEDYSFFQQPPKDPLKVKALKELSDLKKLQDSRLELCIERGREWEQCFMYGDSQSSPVKKVNQAKQQTIFVDEPRTRKPPTW
mmetsp:Transcript_7588/g.11407  ORF Transcript_7588/g.11407 Transcript_7588/m.11407 type:complete len:164 (+) Transcript_7588:96-587(+)